LCFKAPKPLPNPPRRGGLKEAPPKPSPKGEGLKKPHPKPLPVEGLGRLGVSCSLPFRGGLGWGLEVWVGLHFLLNHKITKS